MEQLALNIGPDKSNAERVDAEIRNLLAEEDDYLDLLEINEIGTEKKGVGKTDVSIRACKRVIAKIAKKGNGYCFTVMNPRFAYAFDGVEFTPNGEQPGGTAVFQTFTQIMDLMPKLADYILLVITDMGGAGFGCCNRFIECSDAKACTHPDKKFALQCAYRKNLLAGRIFYGKNCNV